MFQNMMDKSVAKSPWLFHVNAGSCNGCDIEIVAVLTPRYDAERLGFRLAGSPRQADIVVVSGPVTRQTRDRVIRTIEQVPEPRVVVSVGSCPAPATSLRAATPSTAPWKSGSTWTWPSPAAPPSLRQSWLGWLRRRRS